MGPGHFVDVGFAVIVGRVVFVEWLHFERKEASISGRGRVLLRAALSRLELVKCPV